MEFYLNFLAKMLKINLDRYCSTELQLFKKFLRSVGLVLAKKFSYNSRNPNFSNHTKAKHYYIIVSNHLKIQTNTFLLLFSFESSYPLLFFLVGCCIVQG